ELPDASGQAQPYWLQVENGVVGTDGFAHTASPPYSGVGNSGVYMVALGSLGSISLVRGKLNLDITIPWEFVALVDQLAQMAEISLATALSPSISCSIDVSRLQVIAVPRAGLPVTTA